MKFLLYQILGIGIIWTGMVFFFSDMNDMSKAIFYVVSSWLLFLVILLLKELWKRSKGKNDI